MSPKLRYMFFLKNGSWSCERTTSFNSGLMSGTSLRSTLPFLMPKSSCTIAWYVHCVSSGVIGSSLRSSRRRIGGVSGFLKSKSCSSCVNWYLISEASFLAIRLFFSYLIRGFFFNDSRMATTPSVHLCSASGFHVSGVLLHNLCFGKPRSRENRSGFTVI